MTSEASRLHEEYETADARIRATIDAAYTAARKVFEASGYTCANDDRAEVLISELYHYFIDSAEQDGGNRIGQFWDGVAR